MSSRSPERQVDEGPTIQSQQAAQPESVDGEGFLVIKDCNSWGGTANVDALEAGGYSYGVATSEQFTQMSLEGCHTLIIPSTQDYLYYRNLADAREKIASFVETGGTLIGHVTDSGYPCSTIWKERFLPGSIEKTTDYVDNLSVTDDEIFEGLDDGSIDNWNYSAHGFFTEIPDDAEVLAKTAYRGEPTYVRYSYGDGVVLATMQTVEWPWTYNARFNVPDVDAAKGLLENELAFAAGRRGQTSESVSMDVDILSFIPGESENSSRGGNPFNGAVSQFLPPDYTIEVPLNPYYLAAEFAIDVPEFISPKLTVDTTPLFDNWGTGDMILSDNYPEALSEATNPIPNKYEEPGPSSAPRYRTLNGVEIDFETDGDGGIEESTVEVTFTGENTESVLEQEDVNTLKDDVASDNGNALDGGYRDRHFAVETTTVDGTEAVRVGTIFGGFTRVGSQALELLADRGQYDFLNDVLEWDFTVDYGLIEISPDLVLSHLSGLVDGITTALAAVPNIYTHLELTVTADGRRFVRVWDHSPFPEHRLYVEGTEAFSYDFPDEEGTLRELMGPEFVAFLAGATVGRGPYYGSKNQYLACVSEGDCPFDAEEIIGDVVAANPAVANTPYADELVEIALELLNGSRDPVWSYGYDDSGTIDESEVESVLPDELLDPFDERVSHLGQRQFTENL
ncbi:hypothetical protein [Haloarchaeobius sp. HME9146]|uniref:hypothetical protein n=1 Tax=Haloarchaeobius sp. HME9146 TaxID=2978732 RepID=UPI0021C03A3B|nr:hypothetical protein [Haloarchaeobius sp. HME9146]MCT9097936.1 hypothetical protein [Haloarchaeobius sp. HME9146]